MSALIIKILAVAFMLVDHIGFAMGSYGFSELGWGAFYYLCRGVGRLALPLFAFLIANGFKHTKSVKKYALRLLAFALISEIPFDLFTKGKFDIIDPSGRIPNLSLDNVFFTLLFGLCFLWLNDTYKKRALKNAKILSLGTFVVLMVLAGFVSSDYGAVGVAWVALFGILDLGDRKKLPFAFFGAALLAYWRIIARCALVAVYRFTHIHIGKIPGLAYFFAGKLSVVAWLQPFALVALGFILMYNQKSGMPQNKIAKKALQYAFYAIYPLHLLIFALIF